MITFTGGLILGLIIGALVVTALALYILWSPVRGLRDRCREAEQENERVRQANLDVMMHFEDMKAAKEQAEARVAELEQEQSEYAEALADKHEFQRLSQPETLRKQAEAIEDWLHGDADLGGLDDYAQRLRAKAEEQEKGGGDES